MRTIALQSGSNGNCIYVEAGGVRLLFDAALVASLDAAVLESNYEPEMLECGPYPEFLKERIRGPGGHLSNVESAELLRDAVDGRMQWVCLAHLSADNNRPDVALCTHREIFGNRLPIHVARRDRETAVLVLCHSSELGFQGQQLRLAAPEV